MIDDFSPPGGQRDKRKSGLEGGTHMALKRTSKIFPHLWYAKEAEEAAAFYASIFPDSRVERVTQLLSESPSGPAGSAEIVDFTLFGQGFQAVGGGALAPFNIARSMVVVSDVLAYLYA